MAIEDRNLKPGTRLTGSYKKQDYFCDVVEAEDEKTRENVVRYRLEDGREFKSPSSAASAVMGGKAVNGWRFWSLADAGGAEQPIPAGTTAAVVGSGKTGAKTDGQATAGKSNGGKPVGKKSAESKTK